MGALDAYAQPVDRTTAFRSHLIIQGLDDDQAQRDAQTQALEMQRQANERAQAEEKRRAQEDANKTAEGTALIDARSWAGTPGYGVPYHQLPPEAKQHFDSSYSPEIAARAPELYNQAVRQSTGKPVIPGLDNFDIAQATVDPETGKASLQMKPRVDPDAASDLTDDQRTLAEAIARYDVPPSQALSRYKAQGERDKVMAHAVTLGYDAKEYPTRQASRKDFTSGAAARSITSLNTLIHHFDRVLEAKNKLDNYGSPILNAGRNYLRKEVSGNPDITAFDTNSSAVAEEMAKLLKGGVATKSEIEDWKSKLNRDLAPEQLNANIKEMMQLMAGRVDALRNQWQAAYDKPRDLPFIDNSAQAILKKHGFDPTQVDPGAGGTEPGQPAPAAGAAPAAPAAQPSDLPQITTQAQYDALQPGTKYRDSNGKTATKKK